MLSRTCLPLVAEHGVGRAGHGAFHQIGQEAVQLRAAVVGAGQAAAAEAGRLHAEVAAIFLHQHVGRDFRGAEQAVQRLVDRHVFANAVHLGVVSGDFPARVQLDQRQAVRRVAIDFVGRSEDEHGLRRQAAASASSMLSVPMALTAKSVADRSRPNRATAAPRCGSPARCACRSAKDGVDASASRMSASTCR